MTNAQFERLILLIEEAAEVQQAASKALRHGYESWNPFDANKKTNRELLEKEVGDLEWAILKLKQTLDLSAENIEKHCLAKSASAAPYLHFQEGK